MKRATDSRGEIEGYLYSRAHESVVIAAALFMLNPFPRDFIGRVLGSFAPNAHPAMNRRLRKL